MNRTTDESWFGFQQKGEMFVSSVASRYSVSVRCVQCFLSLGIKRTRVAADHLLPSSVEVKNDWSHTSVSPACLRCFDKGNFILTWCWLVQTDAEPSFSINGAATSLNKDCSAELVKMCSKVYKL